MQFTLLYRRRAIYVICDTCDHAHSRSWWKV